MRVLLTVLPVEAHFNTMVPLAWALQAAGHDVRLATKPQLVDRVTGAGLAAVAVGSGDEHTELLGRLGADLVDFYTGVDFTGARQDPPERVLAENDVLTGTFYGLVNDNSFIADLAAHAAAWRPDLLVWEQFTFAGAIVGGSLGIPHCRLVWSPDLFHRMRQKVVAALVEVESADDAHRDWLESAIRTLGGEYSDDLLFGQWQIELSPPEMRLPSYRDSLYTRYVPYNGASVIPEWLRDEPVRPRVALTMGITARSGHYGNPIDVGAVLGELAELDIEVVATLSEEEQAGLPPLPEHVRCTDFVPLHALLPSCDAIIHHGGSGTWASAMAAGVPQLIVASLWDNVFRAEQLAELGAGHYLPPERAEAGVVREKLSSLLTDGGFRAGAAKLRDSMLAQPAPAAIVGRLEEFATTRHTASR